MDEWAGYVLRYTDSKGKIRYGHILSSGNSLLEYRSLTWWEYVKMYACKLWRWLMSE